MKKIAFLLVLISDIALADVNYSMTCIQVDTQIKRCENDEVICYLYDTGWAGFAKSGRGAGISCLKKK